MFRMSNSCCVTSTCGSRHRCWGLSKLTIPRIRFSPRRNTSSRRSWRRCRMKTLSELAEQVLAGQRFEIGLGDFLDAFYRSPNLAMVQPAPVLLAERLPEGSVLDALFAAVAEHLCRRFALPIPAWVFQPARSR